MENVGDRVACLFIEPYGEDYWMNPGEVFTVGPIIEGIDVWFSTFVSRDCITVWLYEDGDPTKVVLDYAVVDAHGTRLDCGHQRPQRSAEAG
ncbi:hypothetical protein ABIA33_007664 [Streptacidiphilus sp. MAP12-16]|uniref:hypothetical protein n=1 Tax=Streptacidiphilus sp. MAP12-16 TaxID=3156300 RepID=UPI0035110047